MEAMSRSIDAKTVSHIFLVENLTGDISWAGEVHNDSLSLQSAIKVLFDQSDTVALAFHTSWNCGASPSHLMKIAVKRWETDTLSYHGYVE